MAELAGHEDDVQLVGDQERGVAVAEPVQRQPFAVAGKSGGLDGLTEALADVAVVE